MTRFTFNEEHDISIPKDEIHLDGLLYIPEKAKGLVLFVHGSGSSRYSPRNQYVARFLNEAGLATLLFDLLTPEEEAFDIHTRELRFNIGLLASRLMTATNWSLEEFPSLNLGYFGSSTGGAAALVAAAQKKAHIKAVVSRGGRPDLAGVFLPQVQAPTLLIVGGNDKTVIELNEAAMHKMQCVHQLEQIQGATHLFEEPGALANVAHLAKDWFTQYLG